MGIYGAVFKLTERRFRDRKLMTILSFQVISDAREKIYHRHRYLTHLCLTVGKIFRSSQQLMDISIPPGLSLLAYSYQNRCI